MTGTAAVVSDSGTQRAVFADKREMQNRLFSELSSMFGREVPLYDKALLVNRECNKAVCQVLSRLHDSFSISDDQLERTSGERHGAIRIGRPDEYRWIARFFAAFAMEPHNYYDMSSVGAKSQPIVATAFRSAIHPEHRVFSSLLQTNYFDPSTQARIESLLAKRRVFSDEAKRLIEKGEKQGGLSWVDAEALIREGTQRIFKWTGRARDFALYKDLCDSGFKIAADIACFESHHLNHLTPNTLCMDLYTAAMKFCLGELGKADFTERARQALGRLIGFADRDFMRLHFKHLSREEVEALKPGVLSEPEIREFAEALTARLCQNDLNLSGLNHSGFKEFTEGPSEDTPILLRQDAYRALTEPVQFVNENGSVVDAKHTARFGEIEQRFYATTVAGRALYDSCLAEADAARDRDPDLAKRDFPAYQRLYAKAFAPFPKNLAGLLQKKLVYGRYSPTAAGLAAKGTIRTTDLTQLVELGLARVEGLRYEDFLPVSAAGIFASNLSQYGTKSTAATRPIYTQAMLEEVIGRTIIDSDAAYRAMEAASVLSTLEALGVVDLLAPDRLASLRSAASNSPESSAG